MQQQSLTQGAPYRQIIRFSIPLLLGNLFQQFYNMADAFIISRTLGVEAFAGVSSTGGITLLVVGFAQGLTVGLSVVLSQSFGAGNHERLRRQYAHNLVICVAAALLLSLLSMAGTGALLGLLRTPADIRQYAHDYLQVIFAGILASILFNLFSNTMRALGDSRTPLYHLLVASGVNIVLDYILILYTPLGVRGAALATVLSQALSAALCAITISRRLKLLSLRDYRGGISRETLLGNLRIGLPMAFQSSIIALGVIVIQFATNGMGTTAVAAYAAAAKIDGIAVEPLRSLGMTMTTWTAQNHGAGLHRRILDGVRQCALLSVGLAVLLGLFMLFCGRQVAVLFVGRERTDILALSHLFLIIHGALYIILALLFVLRFTLQGLGRTAVPTAAGLMELLMRILAALFLVPALAFVGASLATPLSWAGALVPVAVAWHGAAKRMRRALAEEKNLQPHPQ